MNEQIGCLVQDRLQAFTPYFMWCVYRYADRPQATDWRLDFIRSERAFIGVRRRKS